MSGLYSFKRIRILGDVECLAEADISGRKIFRKLGSDFTNLETIGIPVHKAGMKNTLVVIDNYDVNHVVYGEDMQVSLGDLIRIAPSKLVITIKNKISYAYKSVRT